MHEPIKYYRGWDCYRYPILLNGRIPREETEALAARGA
jgi:hypothetical protein